MFKKTITYTDFNGVEQTEDFYFHLSLPEVTRIEAKAGVDISTHAKKLAEGEDISKLVAFFEEVVLTAYGVKSEDGKSFRKSKELRESFEYSPAYAEFFEELLTNPEVAQKFGEGIADRGKKKVKPQVTN